MNVGLKRSRLGVKARFLLPFLFILHFNTQINTQINAQEVQLSASGKVISEVDEPLAGVSVVAISLPDSLYIDSTITDAEGKFTIKGLNQYFLHFSSVGYKSISVVPNGEMRIVLKQDDTVLDELIVTATSIQSKPGGYSLSLKNASHTKGRKAVDIIGMMPNVSYEPKNITILGRPLAAIYLNNLKVTPQEIETLRADQVESISVDYTSSGSEDATTLGGILRIKTKTLSQNGLRGEVSGESSFYPHYGTLDGNLYNSLTSKVGKVSINNNLYISYDHLFGDTEIEQTTQGGPQLTTLSKYRNRELYLYDRIRASYEVDSKSVISISGFYSFINGTPHFTNTDLDANIPNITTTRKARSSTAQGVLNYSLSLDNDLIDITADYLWKSTQDSTELDTYKAFSNKNNHLLRLRPIYTHTFETLGSQLTVGGDFQLIDLKEKTSDNLVPADMRAYTPALYTNYKGQKGMAMYSLGLRYQYNWLSTTQGKQTYTHKFGSLYPTLSIQYMIDPQKGHMLMCQSERGALQIPYSIISEYREYQGHNLYSTGNPSIKTPTTWQNILMVQLWNQLGLSTMYIHIKSPIGFNTQVDPTNSSVYYTRPINGNYQSVLAFAIEWNKPITKWWKLKLSSSLTMLNAKMGYTEAHNQKLWKFVANNSFNFSNSMGGGLTIRYEPTSYYLDRTLESVYSLNGYFFKTFLDGDLELRADALLLNKPRVLITENANLRLKEANVTKQTFVKLSLTYNFSIGKSFKTTRFTNSIQSYETIQDVGK